MALPSPAIDSYHYMRHNLGSLTRDICMAYQLKKLSPKHDEILLYMMLSPGVTLTQMAADLGYTIGWLSQIVNCDLFQARLAQTQKDTAIEIGWLSLKELQVAVAYQGLEKISVKLEHEEDFEKISDVTMKLLKIITPSAEPLPPQIQNNTLILATQAGLEQAKRINQEVQRLIPPLQPSDDLGRDSTGKVIDGRVIDAPKGDLDASANVNSPEASTG